jgi:hypothetical protein
MQNLESKLQKMHVDALSPEKVYEYVCELKEINDLLILKISNNQEKLSKALELRTSFQHLDVYVFCIKKPTNEIKIIKDIHLNLIVQFHNCWMLLPVKSPERDYYMKKSHIELTVTFVKKIQERKYLDQYR